MSPAGSDSNPLRVAVVGSGPAGFYAADALLKAAGVVAEVDLYERLPTPFGLVRYGVAPDHQKIKSVTRAFEKIASHPRFRLRGNVHVGRDVTVAELCEHYHQLVVTIGSASDRKLGVPGEDLGGSHAATSFVNWYNALPEAAGERFDLSHERAIVVGVGNVAMDVARVLLRSVSELGQSDIADHTLALLRESRVREVVVLGRRGAEHAAFDQSEIQDIAELDGVAVDVDGDEIAAALAAAPDADSATRRKLEYLQGLAAAPRKPAERRLVLRFLSSPTALHGDGRVREVEIERNQRQGTSARGTGERTRLAAGLVLRSIGYRGVELPGLPFDAASGTVPNREGRVVDAEGALVPRCYVAGWIKRGPSGVIGTNKSDASATVQRLLEDVPALPDAPRAGGVALDALLAERGLRVTSFSDWKRLDAIEVERGAARGKVRDKLCSVPEMLALLGAAG